MIEMTTSPTTQLLQACNWQLAFTHNQFCENTCCRCGKCCQPAALQ